MNKLLMLGTDSEYFVSHNGAIGSAIGLLGGSKEAPRLVANGNVQEDNVLAEFAIDPCTTSAQWVNNIVSVRAQMLEILNEKGLDIVGKSSHKFGEELFDFPSKAFEFGCDPDWDAYSGQQNPRPNVNTFLRTAAGHIHFSYENPDDMRTRDIIKCLDYSLGVWSVLLDEDKQRRSLYGKAGAYRKKSYGGEYRTLGNFWLATEERMEYVFDTTSVCVSFADDLLPRFHAVMSEAALQDVINEHRVNEAQRVFPLLCNIVEDYYGKLPK